MTFLWAFGTIVERRIGRKCFLAAYHITGLLGGALYVIVRAGILSEGAHYVGESLKQYFMIVVSVIQKQLKKYATLLVIAKQRAIDAGEHSLKHQTHNVKHHND